MNDTTSSTSSSTSSSSSIWRKERHLPYNNNFFIPKSPRAAKGLVWKGKSGKSKNQKRQHQQQQQQQQSARDEFASFQRAVEQVHALLDLYQQGESQQQQQQQQPFSYNNNHYLVSSSSSSSSSPFRSSSSSSCSIAPDIVSTALESVVLQSSSWSTTCNTYTKDVLQLLQGLIDRVAQETLLVPSRQVMDTQWMMLQQQKQQQIDLNACENGEDDDDNVVNDDKSNDKTAFHTADDHMFFLQRSSISTLYYWYQWALVDQMNDPPPQLYFHQLLKQQVHAQQQQQQQQEQQQQSSESSSSPRSSFSPTVSSSTLLLLLWDLYKTAHSFHRKQAASPLSRQCYEWMLAISLSMITSTSSTSTSSSSSTKPMQQEWYDKPCAVLRDMMEWSSFSSSIGDDDDNEPDDSSMSLFLQYRPTLSEWTKVLEQAASLGRVYDVVWLIRMLQQQEQQQQQDSDVECSNNDNKYMLYFVQSLLHSTESGPLHYMERYVLSQEFVDDDDKNENKICHSILGKQSFKMLLQKWSKARIPGSGMRAEAVFQRLEERFLMDNNNTTNSVWRPDEACVQSVVMAYLQEDHSVSLSHVMDAEHFVRDCVAKGYLRNCNARETNHAEYSDDQSMGIFDRLLEAYAFHGNSDPKVADRADELFRYFLIQHRSGSIAEEPGPHHLKYLLRQFHRLPAVTSDIVQKSLEYYRLISLLHNQNSHDLSQPDVFNARQVLCILAQSNQTELGSVAEIILQNVVTNSNLSHYDLGQISWYNVTVAMETEKESSRQLML